jgi:hypothetical protein
MLTYRRGFAYRRLKDKESDSFQFWAVFNADGEMVYPTYSAQDCQRYIQSCKKGTK